MDAVHIHSVGIAGVEVKVDILDREVASAVNVDGVVGGVLEDHVGKAEIAHVVKQHAVPDELLAPVILMRLQRIGQLVHVVAVPDATLDLKIAARIRRVGGKLVHIIPQKARFFGNIVCQTLGGLFDGLIAQHQAVSVVCQTDLRKARQLQLEVRGDHQRIADEIEYLGRGQRDFAHAAVDHFLYRGIVVVYAVTVKNILCHIHASFRFYSVVGW